MQSKAEARMVGAVFAPIVKAPSIQWKDYVVYIFFALVLAFFAFTIGDKGFFSVANLFNITRTTSIIAIMAIAMTFVIAAGELYPSIGSSAALAALVAGLAMQAGFGMPVALIAALASGLAVGCHNSFLATFVGVPSFLVTLGSMQLIRVTTCGSPTQNWFLSQTGHST